jgi:uncharacterized cupredoxin-like copper-binding protein
MTFHAGEPVTADDAREEGRTDSLLVTSVVMACLALLIAAVAMGVSARSASDSSSRLRAAQSSLAAAGAVRTASAVSGGPPLVAVTEHDSAIASAVTTAKGGLVDFAIRNIGPSEHEFLIFRTDLAPDKLPLGSDGRVNEEADAVDKVFDSGNNIGVGASQVFHTALVPGTYVLVCNLPGHYLAGMHAEFTVT